KEDEQNPRHAHHVCNTLGIRMKTWNEPQATEIKMDAEISSYQDDSYDPYRDCPLFMKSDAAETDGDPKLPRA
ncbi:hypothetical protein, partial [uncultured Bradyrhizobium sp.]|uniref:hypothetical protein n=1 Tax=uncultured Bradyrhizobium sp. TaxID=199684 RepID=UPI00261CA2E0